MNNRQKAAIRKAEEAMEELKSAGLALAGVDNGLLVFSRRQYDKVAAKNLNYGNLPSPSEIINELEYEVINCPYMDGGAT